MRRVPLVLFLSASLFLAATVAATAHVTSSTASRRLVEVRVEGYGPTVVDRCMTCHEVPVGSEFPAGHARVPGYHPVDRFGCACCHGGEPRAVEREWAHVGGREPLLHSSSSGERPERIEAGCARCHAAMTPSGPVYDATLVPHVARGQELFLGRGCWGCHRLADVSPGERGPDLSDVGRRLTGDQIHLAIEDPGAAPSSTTMPRFGLPADELGDLVTFLLAQVGAGREAVVATSRALASRRPGTPPRRPIVDEGMAQGGEIMLRLGCGGCHRLQARDGRVGPDLRWEGELRGPRYLHDMVTRPASTVVGSRMPPFDLSETEVGAVVEFLSRQRLAAPADEEAAWREVCARCHGLDGRGRTAVAPYLGRRPRDLSSAAFFRSVEPGRLADSLRHGVAGTPMAAWGEALPVFSGSRVVNFLSRRLHGNGVPAPRRWAVPRRPDELPPEAIDQAESVFAVECSQCHGPEGRGDGPEAAGLRPEPRDLGNGAFVASLSERRLFLSIAHGAVGSAMPDHMEGNSPETIWALVDRVRELAGEPLTGLYTGDRWPWQRTAEKARRPPPRRQVPISTAPDELGD